MAFPDNPYGNEDLDSLRDILAVHNHSTSDRVRVQVSYLLDRGIKTVYEEPFQVDPKRGLQTLYEIADVMIKDLQTIHIDEYRTENDRRGRLVVSAHDVIGIRIQELPEPEDDDRRFNYGD